LATAAKQRHERTGEVIQFENSLNLAGA
jgi:hypothetical protein